MAVGQLQGECANLQGPIEAVVAVSVAAESDNTVGEYLLEMPPRLEISSGGAISLHLVAGQAPSGSTIHLSLANVKVVLRGAMPRSILLEHSGSSVPQCYESFKDGSNCDTMEEEFDACMTAAKQPDAVLRVFARTSSWPAKMCVLQGVVKFAAQREEPGLVAVIPLDGMACFPMHAIRVVGTDPTGNLHAVTIEPQGTLRVSSTSLDTVTLTVHNVWFDPDILPKVVQPVGKVPAVLFPSASGDFDANLPVLERKGLVKDGFLQKERGGMVCTCWVQKRLACSQILDGGIYLTLQ